MLKTLQSIIRDENDTDAPDIERAKLDWPFMTAAVVVCGIMLATIVINH